MIYLFFCVSTALIKRAPLVPGSLTYSSFGGGAGGGGGIVLNHLLPSASIGEKVEGDRSSERLLRALLMNREKNRDEREALDATEEGAMEVRDDGTDGDKGSADTDGRTVGIGRAFEREDSDLDK